MNKYVSDLLCITQCMMLKLTPLWLTVIFYLEVSHYYWINTNWQTLLKYSLIGEQNSASRHLQPLKATCVCQPTNQPTNHKNQPNPCSTTHGDVWHHNLWEDFWHWVWIITCHDYASAGCPFSSPDERHSLPDTTAYRGCGMSLFFKT